MPAISAIALAPGYAHWTLLCFSTSSSSRRPPSSCQSFRVTVKMKSCDGSAWKNLPVLFCSPSGCVRLPFRELAA